jgi:hypothetical protein
MPDDELILFSGLDQTVETNNDWALQEIEAIIERSVEQRDASIALDACKKLVSISKISGLTLAKGLYLIKTQWDKFDEADSFDETAFIHIGLHKHTVDRYVAVWELFAEKSVPVDLIDTMQQRNIKELIPIANAVAQGYEIQQDEWERLADASDFNEISRIVREDIKGSEPRKSGIQIYLTDTGEIWAYQSGDRYFIGSLEVKDDREVIQKAIERIRRSAGMLES